MGYYEGQRDRPCPRCGGIVATLFISVSPMSFSQRCVRCGTTEFTKAEEAQLDGDDHAYMVATSTSPVDPVTGML